MAQGLAGPGGHGPRQGGLAAPRRYSGTADDGRLGAGYTASAATEHRPHVVAIDYGLKRNILRNLVAAGARVTGGAGQRATLRGGDGA